MCLPLFCLFAKQGLTGAQQGNWPSICCAELWVFSARYTRNNQHFIRRAQFDLHFNYALVCLRSYSLRFPTSPTSSGEKTKYSQKIPWFVHYQKLLERSNGTYRLWVLFPSPPWCFYRSDVIAKVADIYWVLQCMKIRDDLYKKIGYSITFPFEYWFEGLERQIQVLLCSQHVQMFNDFYRSL